MIPVKHEGHQTLKVSGGDKALTKHLMERISDPLNLNRGYKRMKANKGAAGVDGMTVSDLYFWIVEHKEALIELFLTGRYEAQLVCGVEIPKPGKGKRVRQLGISCVVDRLVQQAIHKVLDIDSQSVSKRLILKDNILVFLQTFT
jgi:RNA-directed DNA polymerase